MPTTNAVWGIDIGQCALKAIKLRPAGEQVEAVAFDVIEHPKILSQPDANPDELIRAALEKFVSRNDWQGDRFVIGIAGQQTFARFTKLPPVDPKKIPDIVRFEASQQIPFDMDDVVWDYQVFTAPESPDVEVGIFAVRKDLIRKQIEFFGTVGIAPTMVQTIPAALYNFCRFDASEAQDGGATVIIDVGAQNTDLIIAEAHSAWTRNIPLGGNAFTEALIKSFKLSFAKAESLKKTAATSKYARQIFQAMRPVFAELVAEIQRSIGFYSSTHRDVELQRVLALGNAFRLPGLQKYLENNLTIAGGVAKLDKFRRLVPSATINAPQFAENILSFGAAYGLALQGLGPVAINANLLPTELARIAVWKKKRVWFGAAAACMALAAVCPWARTFMDKSALAGQQDLSQKTASIIAEARRYADQYRQVQTDTSGRVAKITKLLDLQKEKRLIPSVFALVTEAIPQIPGVTEELEKVQSPAELKKLIESDPARFGRTRRGQIYIESCDIEYKNDVDAYAATLQTTPGASGVVGAIMPFGGRGGGRRQMGGAMVPTEFSGTPAETAERGESAGFYVSIKGRLLYGEERAQAGSFLIQQYCESIREHGQQPGLGYYVPDNVVDEDKEKEKQGSTFSEVKTEKYVAEGSTAGASPFSGPRSGGRGRMAGMIDPTGFTPGAAVTPETPTDATEDPITGEKTTTDWKFEFGFKVKLGEKPAAAHEKTQPQ